MLLCHTCEISTKVPFFKETKITRAFPDYIIKLQFIEKVLITCVNSVNFTTLVTTLPLGGLASLRSVKNFFENMDASNLMGLHRECNIDSG